MDVEGSAIGIRESVDVQGAGKIERVVGDLLEGWMAEFRNGVTEIGRWIHG